MTVLRTRRFTSAGGAARAARWPPARLLRHSAAPHPLPSAGVSTGTEREACSKLTCPAQRRPEGVPLPRHPRRQARHTRRPAKHGASLPAAAGCAARRHQHRRAWVRAGWGDDTGVARADQEGAEELRAGGAVACSEDAAEAVAGVQGRGRPHGRPHDAAGAAGGGAGRVAGRRVGWRRPGGRRRRQRQQRRRSGAERDGDCAAGGGVRLGHDGGVPSDTAHLTTSPDNPPIGKKP